MRSKPASAWQWRAAFWLARLHIVRHPGRTLLLTLALSLVMALPPSLRLLLRQSEQRMLDRAAGTPLVLGAPGSALDLVFSALYFRLPAPEGFPHGKAREAGADGLAEVVPILARFHAQGAPIVGTSAAYFSRRGLVLARGSPMTRLGDCLPGARVAAARGLKPGDTLLTSPKQPFDLAGAFPLKLRVTGILAATGSPDDEAVFTDLKTAWVLNGDGHGHDDVTASGDGNLVLEKTETAVVASAAVVTHQEITDENARQFHFHGDLDDLPLTAALVFPRDDKADALLSARHQGSAAGARLVSPPREIGALMAHLHRFEALLTSVLALAGGAALAVCLLVFALGFRLRRREFDTLREIGVAPANVRLGKAMEVVLVVAAALMLAIVWLGLATALAPHALRAATTG
jgi:putative ABC transport system permease protein